MFCNFDFSPSGGTEMCFYSWVSESDLVQYISARWVAGRCVL